jgi:hypothetical protein
MFGGGVEIVEEDGSMFDECTLGSQSQAVGDGTAHGGGDAASLSGDSLTFYGTESLHGSISLDLSLDGTLDTNGSLLDDASVDAPHFPAHEEGPDAAHGAPACNGRGCGDSATSSAATPLAASAAGGAPKKAARFAVSQRRPPSSSQSSSLQRRPRPANAPMDSPNHEKLVTSLQSREALFSQLVSSLESVS